MTAIGMGIAAFTCAALGFFFMAKKASHDPAKSKAVPAQRVDPSRQTKQLGTKPGQGPDQDIIPNPPSDKLEAAFYRLVFRTDNLSSESNSAQILKAFDDQYLKLMNDPTLLPRQPIIWPKLMRAVRSEYGNVQELVDIVLEDPGLTADVLKVANSPMYRNSHEPVNDLSYAVIMLGIDGLKSLVTASLVRPIYKSNAKNDKFLANLLWEYALASACISQRYATRFEKGNAFNAHLLTLLTCITDFTIMQIAHRLFVGFDRPDQPETMIHLMTLYRYKVTVALMRAWSLDDSLIAELANPESGELSHSKNAQLFGRALGRAVVLTQQNQLTSDEVITTFSESGISESLTEYLLRRKG